MVIEPVLGSGGCVAPPDSFWPALTELCREHGWLLCADEVKTRDGPLGAPVRGRALGRRARPDVPRQGARRRGDADRRPARVRGARSAASTTCRPAAPGPGCRRRARPPWRRSTSTRDEPVLENVRELERLAAGRLGELRERFDRIGDVRAVGCFQAIEFVRDRETAERDPELQDAVAAELSAPRGAGRLLDHLAQHPAVAGDAAGAARPRLRPRRRGDRGGARRVSALESSSATRARRDGARPGR